MVAEELEEDELASAYKSYEDTGQHVPMEFMASRGEFNELGNTYHWLDQKHPSFTIPISPENTKRDTSAVCTSVDEESIIKETGRVNDPLKFWGYTKSPRYQMDRFHAYRNCPNNMDPDVAERAKWPI